MAYSTISFATRQYYNEAKRLSKNPKLIKKGKSNPILKFVPDFREQLK